MKIHLSQQSGSALVVTIVTTAIIGTTLAAYLNMVGTQHRSVVRSEAWGSSIVMAEAGIEEALQAMVTNPSGLVAQGWTSNAVVLSLNGAITLPNVYTMSRDLSGGRYVASISNYPPTIYCTGYRTTPLGTNELARTVRVLTRNAALFGKGLVAKGLINVANGNVDSFDSGGVTNYSTSIRKSGGDVTSITSDISVGSTGEIRGNAAVSPGHSIASSGDIGPIGTTGNQAGYTSFSASGTIPDPVLPSNVGDLKGTAVNLIDNTTDVFSGATASGIYYATGTPGSKYGKLSDNITVTNGAHVILYVDTIALSGTTTINIYTNSSLTIYAAHDVSIAGNGVANATANALNFNLIGLSTCTSITLSGNGAMVGTIWAPQAALTLNGGGSAGGFIGAAIVNSARFDGTGADFHYDENLGRNGPANGFQVYGWDEL